MIVYITTQGLGQPWVGNELHTIDAARIPFVLHAMRRPAQKLFESVWAEQLNGRTQTLYPLPPTGFTIACLLAPLNFGRRFWTALANAVFGRRENIRARVATLVHFFVACFWARGLRGTGISHVHAQWAHSSASIGMYGAWLAGTTFSFTGHAVDLFRDRVALNEKIRRADFIVCISEFHRQFFLSQGARHDQLILAYCGIDLTHFTPAPATQSGDVNRPVRVLSSGRLVEKKGFAVLIDACAVLRARNVPIEVTIGGSGPLEASLLERARCLGLQSQIRLTGREITQDALPSFMRSGDIYCLPCVWASDGDVDGLPQMLMEAMACGLPAISTRLVGIPDLIIHEQTGLLVEPNDPVQLADAIMRLRDDPELARRLAEAGRRHLAEKFDINTSLEPLIRKFREKLQGSQLQPLAPNPALAQSSAASGQ